MLEPLNQRDRPDYFISRIEHIADIIAKVGEPNMKIMYDFYHVQVMQGDVLKRMEAHLPLIGHVQFAGPPTRCRRRRANSIIRSSSMRSTRWAGKAGSAPNTAPAGRRRIACRGASRTGSVDLAALRCHMYHGMIHRAAMDLGMAIRGFKGKWSEPLFE